MKRETLNSNDNFLNVLVDCYGYSQGEAEEVAEEYRNDLEGFIRDCGGDDNAIKECKEFCGVI